ncbi:MAG TPA: hypothetical protein DCS48_03365 [Desulfovibrio sp.]|nr:hypothetical protein [Desulfovibrio sp.]
MTNIDPGKAAASGFKYQFIWTALRALDIIRPFSTLKRIYPEGVHPADEVDLGDGPETFLGVDLSEYHGSCDRDKCEKIVITQVKYSMSSPKAGWTLGRLAPLGQKTIGKSVTRRLATPFKKYLDLFGVEDTLKRVSMRLVSNQPLAAEVAKSFETICSKIAPVIATKKTISFIDFESLGLDVNEQRLIETFHKSSGLEKDDFAVFLACLDLSGTNTMSRLQLRNNLWEEIKQIGASKPSVQFNNLLGLVEEIALQESGYLSTSDVYASLMIDPEDIFPAESQIELPSHVIATHDASNLRDTIYSSDNNLFLVNGAAGIGKTVTLSSLDQLCESSTLIVYDCYANGKLNSFTRRYEHSVALPQIANQISLEFKIDSFITRKTENYKIYRRFQALLDEVSERLKIRQERLIIAIDAADNAIEELSTYGAAREECCINELWGLDWPENITLVMSCRTERMHKLQAPDSTISFELVGFTPDESHENLKNSQPAWIEAYEDFHKATNGVPRLQSYWIDDLSKKDDPISIILETRSFGLEEYYSDLVKSASSALPTDKHQNALALLTVLSPPIDINIFAKALNIELSQAVSFVKGLRHGLIVDDELLTAKYRDEDFEDYVIQNATKATCIEAHQLLATYCDNNASICDYAFTEFARHLEGAECFEKLVRLADDDQSLAIEENPLKRTKVANDRYKRAIGAAAACKNLEMATKLSFKSAMNAKTKQVADNFFLNYSYLTGRLGDGEAAYASFGRIYGHSLEEIFPVIAGMAATRTDDVVRKFHMEAVGLLHHEAQNKPSQGFSEKLSLYYCAIEYYFEGPSGLKTAIRRWSSPVRQLEIVYLFFKLIFPTLDTNSQEQLLSFLKEELSITCAAALAGLHAVNRSISKEVAFSTVSSVSSWIKRYGDKHSEIIGNWFFDFIELGIVAGASNDQLLSLLDLKGYEGTYSGYFSINEWDNWLSRIRPHAIRAMINETTLNYEDVFGKSKDTSSSFHQGHNVGEIFPVIELRYQVLKGKIDASEQVNAISELIKKMSCWDDRSYQDKRDLMHVWCLEMAKTIVAIGRPCHIKQLRELKTLILERKWIPLVSLTKVGGILAVSSSFSSLAEEFFESAVEWIEVNGEPASENADSLMRCANEALKHSEELAKNYYHLALEKATGVDEELAPILATLCSQIPRHVDSFDLKQTKFLYDGLLALGKRTEVIREGTDFVWPNTISSLATLDNFSVYKTILDLEKESYSNFNELLTGMFMGIIRVDRYNPEEILPFLEFIDPFKIKPSNLSEFLDKTKSNARTYLNTTIDDLTRWITSFTPYSIRPALIDEVVKWTNRNDLFSKLATDLPPLAEVYQSVNEPMSKGRQQDEFEKKREIKSKKNYEELESMIQASPIKLLEKIENNEKVFDGSESNKGKIILNLSEHLAGEELRRLLQAVTKYDHFYYSDRYLLKLINQNKEIPVVKAWVKEELPSLLMNRFFSFFSDDTYESFSNMISDPQKRIEILTHAIRRIDSSLYLSSWLRLYTIALKTLSPDDFASIAKEVVIFYAADASSEPQPSQAGDPFMHQAEFFYELFGHPDNRVRWKAFFALRKVFNYDPEIVVKCVVTKLSLYKGDYWMSARQWGLFWLLNIAQKTPKYLFKHANEIASHALDEAFPHAAIQELSKRISLLLIDNDKNIFSSEKVTQINQINTPIMKEKPKHTHREYRSDERYNFNSTDTMPYWFSRLSHCFGEHRCDVADIAEKWICDEWGVSQDEVREKDRRTSNYSYQLTDHRQGQWPTVENMSRYYDRHGLYMAAGEMIRAKPTVYDSWGESRWEEWLNWWIFGADPLVTSDLLSLQPQDVLKLASSYLPESRNKWLSIDRNQLHNTVFASKEEKKQIIGGGRITIHHRQIGIREIKISSALIPYDQAERLADQINKSNDPYDYTLPIAEISYAQDLEQLHEMVTTGDYDSDRWGYSGVLRKFSPEHWLVNIYSERELHKADNHWLAYSRNWLMPGKNFINFHNAQPSSDYKSYLTSDGRTATTIEIWDDSSFVNENYDFSTNGYRLWASEKEILDFLRYMDKSLVIKVTLSASKADSYSNSDDRLEPVAYAFVLSPDGEIR